RINLVLVVEWPQLGGAKPLAVPRVEVLVARKVEPIEVALACTGGVERDVQDRRVAMLEAVLCRSHDVEEIESIEGSVSPELCDGLGDFRQIPGRLRSVPHSTLTEVHEVVRLAPDAEFVHRR